MGDLGIGFWIALIVIGVGLWLASQMKTPSWSGPPPSPRGGGWGQGPRARVPAWLPDAPPAWLTDDEKKVLIRLAWHPDAIIRQLGLTDFEGEGENRREIPCGSVEDCALEKDRICLAVRPTPPYSVRDVDADRLAQILGVDVVEDSDEKIGRAVARFHIPIRGDRAW